MKIERTKAFKKHYRVRVERNRKLSKQFKDRIHLFLSGHTDQPINDHALSGNMQGLRAFSITGDVRVIYRETDDGYEFIDIGTHAQVYDE